ncbi:glycoside hydrolase family 19 protein [Nocardia transvalensis]|uniref:glycoside hydrolase family 19 protein n=1 Tax=Nocardia transvalensis TaxID=37333 RepID=UPI001E5380B0|nr:glycoside hydrolase family 19 protein [Nocardia transvalensis]
MTPPRSVLATWRASAAAERLRIELDRRIEDVETLSAAVYGECHRLDGDRWQGAAYDAVLTHVDTAHRRNRMFCERAAALRDAGVRALSELHDAVSVLLDCVADAEADGCVVADDWTVTAEADHPAGRWAEVIAEATAAVDRADERGRQAVLAATTEMTYLAALFTLPRPPAHGPTPGVETCLAAPVFITQSPPAVDAPTAGITMEQLVAIMPELPPDRAQEYLPSLNAAMREGEITTPLRQAAFLAQLAYESCELRYFEELGDDDYFRQYDPGRPNTAAGNTEPGDGPRYHGRGPIQLTGRANYRAAGEALGLDLEGDPALAARPDIGFRIAQWYWTSRTLNALADAGDFAGVTQAVNGGYHGLAAREAYYYRALEVLG